MKNLTMAKSRSAYRRYKVIDAMLRSKSRTYPSLTDIQNACLDKLDEYPSRHTLILGDSIKTIPIFTTNNPNKTFDLIFIDGGHAYETALADLLNCKTLAHSETIIIVDDIIFKLDWQREWTLGPSLVWVLATIIDPIINMTSYEMYCPGRGMAWGKYKM